MQKAKCSETVKNQKKNKQSYLKCQRSAVLKQEKQPKCCVVY